MVLPYLFASLLLQIYRTSMERTIGEIPYFINQKRVFLKYADGRSKKASRRLLACSSITIKFAVPLLSS
jgi:hypothetical protein